MPAIKTVGGVGLVLFIVIFALRLLRTKRKCFSVKNKHVIITGANSGLGEACAHAFYETGAKVILCARRGGELQRVKTELLAKKTQDRPEPVVVLLDLSQLNSIPNIVSKIQEEHGPADILINNGGMSYRGELASTALSVDQSVMLVNYFGQVALTKAVLPSMQDRGSGHIVAVSSIQGKISIPFRSAYAASKHALQAFCDCLRAEVAESNIKVTVFSPGYIKTNLSLNAVTQDGRQYGVMDSTTASGMSPIFAARQILNCVETGAPDLISAPISHRVAIFLRTLVPELFFWIMRKRALKQKQELSRST